MIQTLMTLRKEALENILEKGENAGNHILEKGENAGNQCHIKAKSHEFSYSGHKYLYHKYSFWSILAESEYRLGE